VAPAPLEDSIRGHRLISQVVVVGDDRPFIGALVTLDPEALAQTPVPDEQIQAEVQSAIDTANQMVSKAEQIKKFVILDHDLTEETGHLTPSLKVKRNVVMRDFAKQIDELYGA
jgi:long-chain acyl-CoA synthetase